MKKIIYIGVALFAFGMASCSKQDIQPNATNATSEPVWRSSTPDAEILGGVGEGGTEGTITDPNNDPDGSKGKL